jgi:hypothetical protein
MGSDRSEGEWMDMTTGLVMKSSKGVVWASKQAQEEGKVYGSSRRASGMRGRATG